MMKIDLAGEVLQPFMAKSMCIETRLQGTIDLPGVGSRGHLRKEVGRQPRDATPETAGSENCTASIGPAPRYNRNKAGSCPSRKGSI